MNKDRYMELLGRFGEKRIVVLGDFLLDQYIVGNSARVSREAPIVVVDYLDTINHPGGAANASQNIAGLGAAVAAIGVIGDDREGDALAGLLADVGVDTAGLVIDGAFATPVKLRILAGELNAQKQQVARVDRSRRLVLGEDLTARIRPQLDAALEGADALLVSDYSVGIAPGKLSEAAIATCRRRGIPVVVDSRFHLLDYAGATVATPNEVEALGALDWKDEGDPPPIDRVARELAKKAGIEGVVVTRGSLGMFVYSSGETGEEIGVVGSNEATDVTGAGDTVSAVIALSIASGATLSEAARMATCAAAVVVMKRGTATVSPREFERLVSAGLPN